MALFDNINSRYTQSMAEGGSYRRDAAEGGYDRKELRGLSKQAKSGSLTQRERARYNYLKKERKGRRKRGLLAGLGGAAALAGGLAAAGKLGKGDGSLMDSIKDRFAQRRADKLGEQGESSLEEMDPLETKEIEREEDRGARGLEGPQASSNMQEPSDMELFDEYGKSFDGMEGELRARNKASQVVQGQHPLDMYRGYDPETGISDGRGRIGPDEDMLAPGGSYENEADLRYMRGNNEFFKNTTDASFPMSDDEDWRRQELAWDADDQEGFFRPFGYEAERDIPAEGRPLTEADALRSRMARRPGQPYDRSGLPDPEYRVGPPVRTGGPRAKFGMKVKTQKQEKLDRLRKFMKNRYR